MRWRLLIAALIAGFGLSFAAVRALPTATVSGVVLDENSQPVEGASVRVKATTNATTTGPDGTFALANVPEGITATITAWYAEYYITETHVIPPVSGVTFQLNPYPTTDNPDYPWIFPHRADSPPEVDYGCDTCHASIIVAQWESNAHSGAATNPRFFSMYNGTDTTGRPGVAPGYKLDFPNTAGNCANCHAPGAAANKPFTADMNQLSSVETNGVFCDFCHKAGGVYLDPATGLPYPNVPGVMSMDLRRPPDGQQMFFGPFDDIPEPDTLLPMIKQGQFCAACHNFSFWGTPIYQSFAEWLASPYPAQGVHCQTCHMPPDGVTTNFAPGAGGVERDPETIPSHFQFGATNQEFLQTTVSMTVQAAVIGRQGGRGAGGQGSGGARERRSGGAGERIRVTVAITNTQAGHHVPTDQPARHMILVVRATDGGGAELTQVAGEAVPAWCGVGQDPDDYAGRPGKAFAKVLRSLNTGEEPTAAYWTPTIIVSDNRIPALGVDTSIYEFSAPPAGTANVEATLIFRRAFKELMEDKRWDTPDIVMEQETRSVVVP
ncbi:MAG: hypothetical protein MAG451_00704 [Anaerolineales bacterium]|nr:hypothetical protein [Anaerolineales bacterium]